MIVAGGSLIYRTAVYGPVCRVVWEGEAARPLPIAWDQSLLRSPAFQRISCKAARSSSSSRLFFVLGRVDCFAYQAVQTIQLVAGEFDEVAFHRRIPLQIKVGCNQLVLN